MVTVVAQCSVELGVEALGVTMKAIGAVAMAAPARVMFKNIEI